MDNALGYREKLRSDLPEQFKGKPNIEALQGAFAKSLEEVYEFLAELNTLRRLKTAEGAELDGIGDIVAMSRADALAVSRSAGINVPMDDSNYRLYLTFKIHLNTNECTHKDLFRAFRMFWSGTPLYYSEDLSYPATIFITIPERKQTISAVEWNVLQIATMVKAAGVTLYYVLEVSVTVQATVDTTHNVFRYGLTGTYYCGTRPQYEVLAELSDTGVLVGVSRQYGFADYTLAGTKPQPEILFEQDGLIVAPAITGENYAIAYPLADELLTGTHPQINVKGAAADAVVGASVDGQGAVYRFDIAGTKPQQAVLFDQDGLVIAPVIAGESYAALHPLTDEAMNAGTKPQANVSAGLTDADVSVEADWHGYVYQHDTAGTKPRADTEFAGRHDGVSPVIVTVNYRVSYVPCGTRITGQ